MIKAKLLHIIYQHYIIVLNPTTKMSELGLPSMI